MAGAFPGGGAGRFRDGIRFVFDMAAPPDQDRQAIFHFPSQLVYVDPLDSDLGRDAAGVPFDPEVPVERQELDPVKVPCAVEYFDSTGQQLGGFGVVKAARVKVTLLDEDYAQVDGCDRVMIDGDTYWYHSTTPPSGLFDVGLFELWFSAEQET